MRKIITVHEYPPVPSRKFDWCAYFEGCEEEGGYGHGATEGEAVYELLSAYLDDANEMEIMKRCNAYDIMVQALKFYADRKSYISGEVTKNDGSIALTALKLAGAL